MRRRALLLGVLLLSAGAAQGAEDAEVLPQLAEWNRTEAAGELKTLGGILEQSVRSYETVKDYKAVFRKQERSEGQMGPKETIFLKFSKPFKIFMHWFDTHKRGLQVLYERGRHGGKLAIHKPGLLLGLAPVVFLDRNSPWVREGSESYDIEDAGIGTFLYDFSKMVLKGAREKKIRARVENTPSGESVDVSFPGSAAGDGYFASRVETLFDPGSHLPVRMSLYDWEGNVTGIYSYEELGLNVGDADPEFKRLAQRKLFSLFQSPAAKLPQRNNFASGKS